MAQGHGGATAPSNQIVEPQPKRRRKRITAQRPRYARNEQVKGGTLKRSKQRLERTGPIQGVNASDGITGREARKIKRVANRRGPSTPSRPNRNRPLTPEQLEAREIAREVNARADLRFGDLERDLDYQRRQSEQFATNLGGYYAQHQQDMLVAQQRQAGFAQGFQAAAYGAAQQAATTDQGQNQQLLAQQQASAAQRGTTVDPALQAQMQGAVAARQVMGNAGGNLIGAQGQAQTAFMGNRVQVAGEQGIQAATDEQNRMRKINELAEALLDKKGLYKTEVRADIQSTRHKERLEEAVFNVETADTMADNARQNRAERRQARSDRALRRDRRLDNRRADRAEARQEREANSRIEDRRADNRRADLADDGKRNNSVVKRDIDGDGIADSGPYRGLSESERDKMSGALRLLQRKGITAKNGQQALDALIFEEHIPPRLAKRALRVHLKRRRRHAGSLTPRNPDGTPG